MAIDLIDTFPQLVRGYSSKMTDLGIALNFFFQAASECIGVRFDQTYQSVREHHTHPPRPEHEPPASHPNFHSGILSGPTLNRQLHGFDHRFKSLWDCDGARNHACRFRPAQESQARFTLIVRMHGEPGPYQDFVKIAS